MLAPASAIGRAKAGKSANNEDLIRYSGPEADRRSQKRMKYFLVCTAIAM